MPDEAADVQRRDSRCGTQARVNEVCVLVAEVPNAPNVEWLGRVRLSSGKTVKSQFNEDVPPVGYMAGSQPLISH